jgi:hypothetical protein
MILLIYDQDWNKRLPALIFFAWRVGKKGCIERQKAWRERGGLSVEYDRLFRSKPVTVSRIYIL